MKDNKAQIIGIFPTPIYISSVNREFSKEENLFFNNFYEKTIDNVGNKITDYTYVLEDELMINLKNILLSCLNDYYNKIIDSTNNISSYITTSWLNFTKSGEYHHKHRHSNSLVSGVLYINTDQSYDKICFHNDTFYKLINLNIKDTSFGTENIYIPVKTGDILLFPSDLSHSVQHKEGNNLRISLSFNTFIKGTFGIGSSELKL